MTGKTLSGLGRGCLDQPHEEAFTLLKRWLTSGGVATAVGGVVDLLGSPETRPEPELGYAVCSRGVLVDSGNVEHFARGVQRLIDDAELRFRLGRRGRGFVLQNYAKERLLADISNLYEELLQP